MSKRPNITRTFTREELSRRYGDLDTHKGYGKTALAVLIFVIFMSIVAINVIKLFA